MSSVSPAHEVLKHLFLAEDALLGQTWFQTTCIPLSADSLHHLVLASKIPSVVKARDVYGLGGRIAEVFPKVMILAKLALTW
jgi:hypothetical protein